MLLKGNGKYKLVHLHDFILGYDDWCKRKVNTSDLGKRWGLTAMTVCNRFNWMLYHGKLNPSWFYPDEREEAKTYVIG